MIFFPAIDIKNGECVRLLYGEMDKATVFGDNPAAQAKEFVNAGAKWLHMVDLNGAFSGKSVNAAAICGVISAIDIPVQLGGGIRTMADIEHWLENGITRVILGTVAVRDPELVIKACRKYPNQIALGIDSKNGFVAVEGWAEVSEMRAIDLAKRFEDAGAAVIIATDIARDGAMQGPNLEHTLQMANAVSTPVIASGGVSSMDDLRALKKAGRGLLEGVISGRAVYDGAIDVKQAQILLSARP